MAGFTDLPPEIVGHICRELCPHCIVPKPHEVPVDPILFDDAKDGWHALLDLSLVCKKVCDQAQPVINQMVGNFHRVAFPLHLFCRTISARTDLGACVLDIRLDAGYSSPWTGNEELSWIEPVIERFRPRLDYDTVPARSHADWRVFIRNLLPALTLLQLPRLKRLDIRGLDTKHSFDYIKRQRGSAAKFLPGLLFLRAGNAEIESHPRILPMSLSERHLGGFLTDFSSLRLFVLYNVQNSTVPQKLSFPNVYAIRLHDCRLSKQSLARIINAAGNLIMFYYDEVGYRFVHDARLDLPINNEIPATSLDVISLLEAKKDSLSVLHLHTHYRGIHDETSPREESLEPLSRLHRLGTIKLNVRTFCDPVYFARNNNIHPGDGLLLSHLPPRVHTISITAGPSGFNHLLPTLERFYEDSPENPLSPSALRLRSIEIDIRGIETEYETANAVNEDLGRPDEIIEAFQKKCARWADNGKRALQIVVA